MKIKCDMAEFVKLVRWCEHNQIMDECYACMFYDQDCAGIEEHIEMQSNNAEERPEGCP